MQAKVFLRKRITNRIALGHPWVFSNEIGEVENFTQPGQMVDVFSSNGSFVGKGYYNPASKVAVRLLTRQREAVLDQQFFLNKIKEAASIRVNSHKAFQRIVAGEADFLPGLIVDKIQQYVVFQTSTLGMEKWKDTIASCLIALYPDCLIFEKNDGHFRRAEQLPVHKRFWTVGKTPEFVFEFEGVKLKIDMEQAPRTGLFWEQLLVYPHLKPYFSGKKVLDAFCHHGLLVFGAQKNGAEEAIGMDWSENVVAAAEKNKILNGSSKNVHFCTGNSFTALQKWRMENKTFDLILLDPPGLSGIGKKIETVLSGYGKLINGAMKLLPSAGWLLLTMSGHFFSEELLLGHFHQLARENNKRWRIVERIDQGGDHPVLWNVPATKYFQAWLIFVEDEQ